MCGQLKSPVMSKTSRRIASQRRDGNFLDRLEASIRLLFLPVRESFLGSCANGRLMPQSENRTRTNMLKCGPKIRDAHSSPQSTKHHKSFVDARETASDDVARCSLRAHSNVMCRCRVDELSRGDHEHNQDLKVWAARLWPLYFC